MPFSNLQSKANRNDSQPPHKLLHPGLPPPSAITTTHGPEKPHQTRLSAVQRVPAALQTSAIEDSQKHLLIHATNEVQLQPEMRTTGPQKTEKLDACSSSGLSPLLIKHLRKSITRIALTRDIQLGLQLRMREKRELLALSSIERNGPRAATAVLLDTHSARTHQHPHPEI